MRMDIAARILARDRHCLCGKPGVEVHHIVPRSKFGKNGVEIRDDESNLILLCRECHEKAHTRRSAIALLKYMQWAYGYEYTDPRFTDYLNDLSIDVDEIVFRLRDGRYPADASNFSECHGDRLSSLESYSRGAYEESHG